MLRRLVVVLCLPLCLAVLVACQASSAGALDRSLGGRISVAIASRRRSSR